MLICIISVLDSDFDRLRLSEKSLSGSSLHKNCSPDPDQGAEKKSQTTLFGFRSAQKHQILFKKPKMVKYFKLFKVNNIYSHWHWSLGCVSFLRKLLKANGMTSDKIESKARWLTLNKIKLNQKSAPNIYKKQVELKYENFLYVL